MLPEVGWSWKKILTSVVHISLVLSRAKEKSFDRKKGRKKETEWLIIGRSRDRGWFKDGWMDGKRGVARGRGNVNQQRCTGSVRTERQVALAKTRPAGVRRLLSRRGRFLRPFPTRGKYNAWRHWFTMPFFIHGSRHGQTQNDTPPLPFSNSVSSVARIREPERPLF